MQTCESKKLKLVPYLAVVVILLVAFPLTMHSNCEQPICFFTTDKNETSFTKQLEYYSFNNWVLTYIIIMIGIIVAAIATSKIMDDVDAGFWLGLVAFACLICIGLPVLHGNIGDCDAPLCYLDGPLNDKDIYENNAVNYQAFYIVTLIQILFYVFTLMAVMEYVERGEKYIRIFLTGLLVALFCVAAPILNNNTGECNMPLCYFGASDAPNDSIYDSQRESHENMNVMAFLFVLMIQIILGYFFIISACNLKSKPDEQLNKS